MATGRGRQPSTFSNTSPTCCRYSDCWFSCHAGASMMVVDEPPCSANTSLISAANDAMSLSEKLRVWVVTTNASSVAITRPTLFDVCTVSAIVSLMATTPCGICSSDVISAVKSLSSTTRSATSTFSMRQKAPDSRSPYSSRNHSLKASSCAFTYSAASPDGTVSTISACVAIEALASPTESDANAMSTSL